MTTLLGSASLGLQLWWSIWEGVTWCSLLVWSWHCLLGLLQTGSASFAWWHSSVDTVSLQYKSHRQYLQLIWLQALVHCYLENISLWEGVVRIGPERKYLLIIVKIFHFGRVFRSWKRFSSYFTLGGCWGSGRQSVWNYWYIVAPWLEMWPIPPQWCTLICEDVVASPSVSGTSYNANLLFILPWKEIDFLTYHQCSLSLCSLDLVMALGVLGLQCN